MATEPQRQKKREFYALNKDAISAYQKDYRRRTNDSSTKRYEKTKQGFLMRCYRNMQSRVNGVQKLKSHLYKGKSLLDRQSFYEWSLENKDFHTLFDQWEKNGYDRKLAPSINRVKSSLGYELNNMEWITHSENSRRTTRWGYDINILMPL